MTVVCDAAPLVALGDRLDPSQGPIEDVLRAESGALVVPAPVLAEVDYIRGERLGREARLAFLEDVTAGRFLVEDLVADEYELVLDVERRYEELDLGLADASIVVLAHRFRTRRLLTFDERDFRTVRPLRGGSFTLLPREA